MHEREESVLPTSRPFSIPAWALSLVLHAALLVLLSVVMRSATPSVEREPERSVGIVLSQRSAQNERVYFDQQTMQEQDAARPAESPTDSADAAQSLPSAADAPSLDSALALPSNAGPFAADESRLADVALSSKGRPRMYSGEDEEAIIAADLAQQRARGGPVGPPTETAMFGSAPAVGRSFVFVIDRSQSMGDTGLGVLRAAEAELARALAPLRPNHEFQIIAYNKTPLPFHAGGLAPADETNKERAIAFLRNLTAIGGTGHVSALQAALRQEPDVIFLLTDGGDPRLTKPEIDDLVRRARGRTSIVCLQFGFGASPDESGEAMQSLARRTGGNYAYINMSGRRAE